MKLWDLQSVCTILTNKKRDELGYAERSSAKDGMIPTDTLGSLILRYGSTTFNCGTGFNELQRKDIWEKYGGLSW